MLSKEDIVNAKDIESQVVPVPEWGGEVTVKGLSLEEKDIWTESIMKDGEPDVKGATAKLCIMCIYNDSGQRLFDLGDADIIQSKSAAAIDRIFQVAQKLSGIGQEDIEETVKNSEKTQTPASD